MPVPSVMTLIQWAAANGRVTTADVDAHLHAGLRSKPRWKSYDRWFAQRLRELQDARDATTRDYEAACERGEVRPPTYTERLSQTATGSGKAAEAARRLIEKRAAKKSA